LNIIRKEKNKEKNMETTSDDLVILERAVGVFTDKLNSVRAYMVSYNQERRENSVALAWR
jgi:hypothetical protein